MRETHRKHSAVSFSSEGLIARRPNLFRALGRNDPPLTMEIDERRYRREGILKHDSWAATAVYHDDRGHRVACKFFRVHPIVFLPMGWLGRLFARREGKVLRLVRGIEGFPRPAGPVSADGLLLPNAVAHEWIDGQTFTPWARVDEQFFPRLRAMIAELHALDIAYVDMSKWENILIGDDAHPYLLDYQIHFQLPRHWPLRWWLRRLQAADLYYLHRHWMRARPEQLSQADREAWALEPGSVRVGEALGAWWRPIRLVGLRLFGVRGDPRRRSP